LANLGKPDHLVSYSGVPGFGRFRGESRVGDKFKDLKIQGILRHGK
jgi:hypothetical protein